LRKRTEPSMHILDRYWIWR